MKNSKNKAIRVVMIIQNYLPLVGGAERQLAALVPLLQERNMEIQIITRRYTGLAPFAVIKGVPVHRLPSVGPKITASLMFTLTALPLIKRLHPDIIHAHGLLSPTTTAVAAKRLFGIPVTSKPLRGGILGGLDRLRRKPFGRHRIATFQQHVDAFITISKEIATELIEAGIPLESCFFIPNGVDIERFTCPSLNHKKTLRESLGLPKDRQIVIYTGRLVAEKGIDQLINIWPTVHNTHPQALLLIAGTGSEETKLKQIAGADVQFLGQVEDVVPYLQASDLFVLPSITEGLSNSVLEAMASGLPVIATAVGGTPDVIIHKETGWLIPSNTPTALQEALLALLADAAGRHQLGNQGRDFVAKEYALTRTADRLAVLYKQLIVNLK